MPYTSLAATRRTLSPPLARPFRLKMLKGGCGNTNYDSLRHDVFEMVRNDAFKEYREARFLKDFHDDPDKWEQLKSGERHVATRLSTEVKSNASSPRAKISSIPLMIRRSIERGEADFGDEDIESLQLAMDYIGDQIHEGVRPFRIALKKMTRSLSEASMADVKALAFDELGTLLLTANIAGFCPELP